MRWDRIVAALAAVSLVVGCAGSGSDADVWSRAAGAGPDQPPSAPGTACTSGTVRQQACGTRCGIQYATCIGGSWSAWSGCQDGGECEAGATQAQACGSAVGACVAGTQQRTCLTSCSWGAWGACGGTYVGPVAEICGNGLDDDCNGFVDDDCDGIVVAPVVKLVGDATRGLLYVLTDGATADVTVYDGRTRSEVERIRLPAFGSDMDLSPDGTRLVVAHEVSNQISVVDLAAASVSATVPVTSDPCRIEVSDAGLVYYVELDQWTAVRRVDPAAGPSSDTLLTQYTVYEGDLELSPDGRSLYTGEAWLSGSNLVRWDVSGGGFVQADRSTWNGGYGFPYPARRVTLSADGARVYYAQHQLDARNLATALGSTGETVFAEDPAGTWAVGERSVFDARTLRRLGGLPQVAGDAAFATSTVFAWYAPSKGKLYWGDAMVYGAPATLGSRALDPEPLGSYTLSRLARDPARPRLYGVDATRNLVVSIDANTLAPLGAIQVGSIPTDLALSLAGDVLWVGHRDTQALARIDRARFAFDRFVPVGDVPFEVEALSSMRVAVNSWDQWTTPAIVDGDTGAVLSSGGMFYAGELAATADGNVLFVGEGGISGGNLTRFDVSDGRLVATLKTTYDGGYGFPYPDGSVLTLPDGSAVYYAGYLIEGMNLVTLRYRQVERFLAITPDGRLATSAGRVYRVSDGALLGTLPVSGAVQAMSPDGATLYVAGAGTIAKVDLGVY